MSQLAEEEEAGSADDLSSLEAELDAAMHAFKASGDRHSSVSAHQGVLQTQQTLCIAQQAPPAAADPAAEGGGGAAVQQSVTGSLEVTAEGDSAAGLDGPLLISQVGHGGACLCPVCL